MANASLVAGWASDPDDPAAAVMVRAARDVIADYLLPFVASRAGVILAIHITTTTTMINIFLAYGISKM